MTATNNGSATIGVSPESFKITADNRQVYLGSTQWIMASTMPSVMNSMNRLGGSYTKADAAKQQATLAELQRTNLLVAELLPGGTATGDVPILIDPGAKPIGADCYNPAPPSQPIPRLAP